VVVKPYIHQYLTDNSFRRIFTEDVETEELVWHRDRKNRVVEVIKCNGWKIQYDNKLPVTLKEGDKLKINAFEYHRLIKGTGELIIEITEDDAG